MECHLQCFGTSTETPWREENGTVKEPQVILHQAFSFILTQPRDRPDPGACLFQMAPDYIWRLRLNLFPGGCIWPLPAWARLHPAVQINPLHAWSYPDWTAVSSWAHLYSVYNDGKKSVGWGDPFAMHLGEWPLLHKEAKAAQQNESWEGIQSLFRKWWREGGQKVKPNWEQRCVYAEGKYWCENRMLVNKVSLHWKSRTIRGSKLPTKPTQPLWRFIGGNAICVHT